MLGEIDVRKVPLDVKSNSEPCRLCLFLCTLYNLCVTLPLYVLEMSLAEAGPNKRYPVSFSKKLRHALFVDRK